MNRSVYSADCVKAYTSHFFKPKAQNQSKTKSGNIPYLQGLPRPHSIATVWRHGLGERFVHPSTASNYAGLLGFWSMGWFGLLGRLWSSGLMWESCLVPPSSIGLTLPLRCARRQGENMQESNTISHVMTTTRTTTKTIHTISYIITGETLNRRKAIYSQPFEIKPFKSLHTSVTFS